MIPEEQQEQACLYALGALTEAERAAFQAEMASSIELREFTRSLQSTVALVARATPGTLPNSLKGKIMQRIDHSVTTSRSAPLPAGIKFLIGADQDGWKPLPVEGASIKLLSLERDRGYAVLLGKLEAGSRYPAHINAGPEDIYVLSGDLSIGERKLIAGDFHHADGGSQHEENYSAHGCTLIAVLTTDDPLVAFAAA